MNSYSPLLPYTISLGIGITIGLGRCEWYEAIAIFWFGCGCWIAFDWRCEFTLSKCVICIICLLLGTIRVKYQHCINDIKATVISVIIPTEHNGIVELPGHGLVKSNYKYSDEKLEEYLGQLKSIELNDYYKSHGCKGEFTPVYLVRSCPKNLHLKDKYRSIIDSVLQSTQEPAKGIIK